VLRTGRRQCFTVVYPPLYLVLRVVSRPAGPVTTGSVVTVTGTLSNHTATSRTVTLTATFIYVSPSGQRYTISGSTCPFRLAVGQPARPTRCTPAMLDAMITDDGLVNVPITRSGHVLSTILVGGSPSAIVVVVDWARAFVANVDAGSVAVIDTRTGMLVRTVPMGQYSEELAYDKYACRVFVANQGDNTVTLLDARTGWPVRLCASRSHRTASRSAIATMRRSSPVCLVLSWAWMYRRECLVFSALSFMAPTRPAMSLSSQRMMGTVSCWLRMTPKYTRSTRIAAA